MTLSDTEQLSKLQADVINLKPYVTSEMYGHDLKDCYQFYCFQQMMLCLIITTHNRVYTQFASLT